MQHIILPTFVHGFMVRKILTVRLDVYQLDSKKIKKNVIQELIMKHMSRKMVTHNLFKILRK